MDRYTQFYYNQIKLGVFITLIGAIVLIITAVIDSLFH